jgi:hypothetical protein
MKNPKIKLDKSGLQGRDLEIARRCLGRDERLRATKPRMDDDIGREATYVWRMVAFECSIDSRHWCIPMTAEFDLPDEYWDRGDVHGSARRRQSRVKELDAVVEAMVSTVNARERHGVNRWARAMGAPV